MNRLRADTQALELMVLLLYTFAKLGSGSQKAGCDVIGGTKVTFEFNMQPRNLLKE